MFDTLIDVATGVIVGERVWVSTEIAWYETHESALAISRVITLVSLPVYRISVFIDVRSHIDAQTDIVSGVGRGNTVWQKKRNAAKGERPFLSIIREARAADIQIGSSIDIDVFSFVTTKGVLGRVHGFVSVVGEDLNA